MFDRRRFATNVAALMGGRQPDFYVDSVNGDDGNTGTIEADAFQTLAAAQAALSAGKTLALVRGSYWREQLDVPADNITIMVAGSGDMPVIDGADIVTTGWTQPDAVTYPNVWSREWIRASATDTASEMLGYWQAGVRTTRQTSLANLQAGSNGHWHTTSLTTQTSTISIRAAADPNSDGILREIAKRHNAINNKYPERSGMTVAGPMELKRHLGHDGSLAGGLATTMRQILFRDGGVHHAVAAFALAEDCIATEFSPDIAPTVFTAYRTASAGFEPVFRRCFALLPGGASRPSSGTAFYSHGSDGKVTKLTLSQCASRGVNLGSADATLMRVENCYAEDPYTYAITGAATLTEIVRTVVLDKGVAPGSANGVFARGTASLSTFTMEDVCSYTTKNKPINNTGTGGTKPVLRNNSIISGAGGLVNGEFDAQFNVFGQYTGFMLETITNLYVGDKNVYIRKEVDGIYFQWNGNSYLSLALFQAASGQDANSVHTMIADQVASDPDALWLAVKNATSDGPPAGDFTLNSAAKVRNGAGSTLVGVFADTTTAITLAGAQNHWDWNLRATVAGAPSAAPTLPATVAEMRTYVEDPTAWDFYP